MKSTYTILAATFLLLSTFTLAQQGEPKRSTRTPGVTKGYYSIGNNDLKLSPGFWPAPDTVVSPVVSKGYYSIGSNNDKLKKKPVWKRKQSYTPVITKGYYSIGNHAEKLARP